MKASGRHLEESLWRKVAYGALFGLAWLLYKVGRWFVRQVLARVAYALLLVLAALLLTDAERGEPQPAPAE